MFAELFTYAECTQIALMRQGTTEGDPEVKAAFDSPNRELGVCGASVIFPRPTSTDPDGSADNCFRSHNAYTARAWADDLMRKITKRLANLPSKGRR